jgi:sugar lactone lactonase YvrE
MILAGTGCVVLLTAAGASATSKPTAPRIAGPRTARTGKRYTYVFSSREQGVPSSDLRFACSLDSRKLHACPRRLTRTFTAGKHVLRAQAIDHSGRRSSISRLTIVAKTSIQQLKSTKLWQVTVDSQATGHNFFDVAVGSEGRLYVADSVADRIDVYNPNGTPAFTFGSKGTGPGEFSFGSPDPVGLGGVGIDPATGDVYVADSANHRIETFTPTGSFIAQWGATTLGEVVDVVVRPDGAVFTVEDNPNSIKQFTEAGMLVKALSIPLADAGGISLAGDGNLLAADYGSGTFSIVDQSGNLVKRVPIPNMSRASNVAADAAGRIYVTDSNYARVDVFNAAGKQTGYLRTPVQPTGVAVGTDALYVTTYNGTLIAYNLP